MTSLRQSFTPPRTQPFHRHHRAFAGRAGGPTRKTIYIPRLTALEARTLLTTLVVDPAGGTGVYTTIQAAVDAANAAGGDSIEIHPATYTEQVTIDKSLTMMGTGPGAIIQAPSTLTQDPVSGLFALVEINNSATVNMSDLTVQGPVGPFTQPATINAGILVVGGATANVTNSTIAHIRNDPLTGVGNTGQAIEIGGARGSGQVGTATITNDIITDYQKTGILVRGGSTATITGNTISGSGPTAAIAQNGIQVDLGATATITGNTITGNEYTNSTPDPTDSNQATGILIDNFAPVIAGGPIIVSNNTFGGTAAGAGNDLGISISNPEITVEISGNTLQGNRFEGVLLSDGTATISNNNISGSNIGVAIVAFSGDTANANGTLTSNNITDNGNGNLSVPGGGIRLLTESGATTTVQATAHFNRIVGNSVGLDNTTAATVDATLNWWGSNAGPNGTGSDTTSGAATTSPWLVLTALAVPTVIGPGGTAVVTADLTTDSDGATHAAAPFFPENTPIAFSATGGTIAPTSVPTASGMALSTFISTTAGAGTASATLDNQTVTTPITVAAINFPPPQSSPVTAGRPFSQSFVATGGAGGFIYAVSPTGGQLPPGLTLDSTTGLVSGTPTTPGTFPFTVTATDLSGASVSVNSTILVNQALVINPITPPQGTVGTSYSAQLSTSGGTAPVTFALSGGTALPPGLVLSPAGLISGTPTAAGTFAFTVTATDSSGAVASLPLSIVVTPASQVAAPTVVNLQRFGFHAQPTTFVLTFSTALDPATAQDPANYRLNAVIGHRIGHAIRIKAAIYDPTIHAVTLHPAGRLKLFARYHLVVNGSTPTGVAGATGLLLDGRGNGVPGTDYVATFGTEILAGPNDPPRISRRSLHHQNLPTMTHASSHQPTGSTAASRNQALSALAVDAVLAEVVRPRRHKR
jgi:hypothetical protein